MINEILDLFDLSTRQRLIVVEVKTQIAWRYNRTGLLDVCSQDFTQCSVHEVGRGVIAASGIALFDVDFSGNCVTNLQRTFFNFHFVNNQTLHR